MSTPPPGTVVDRYRIEEILGSGSMGDVVRAVDVELGRAVAIKVLSERHRDNDELRARFVREGRAVAAISHPNVVQVYTTGTHDGRPYIAMELLRGVDLGTVVARSGVMTSLTAARAVLDAARGLQAAAGAGLIHRDVKPSNLVLIDSGLVKVTDFGLAKPMDPGKEPALTAMGVVVGTPDYIAPEQARGEDIDERVDIYALGGTLYFLLAGKPPFRTGNPAEDKYLKVVARHLREPAPDPRRVSATVDPELAALGLRMMAKLPGDRPRYPALLEQLATMVERLQASGAPRVRAASAPTSPTPALGVRRQDSDPAGRPPERESTAVVRRRDGAAPVTANGAAASWVDDLDMPAIRPSRWLVAITVLATGIFVTGLALYLFGPRPNVTHATAAPATADAAPTLPTAPAVALPEPPTGMALISRAGAPRLWVDLRPVSVADFKGQARPTKKLKSTPATGVSFAAAEAFAKGQGKRLLRPVEWTAIEAEPPKGWVAARGLWEWIDDGARGAQAQRAVRDATGKAARRSPGGHPNVTFRLARDLPAR